MINNILTKFGRGKVPDKLRVNNPIFKQQAKVVLKTSQKTESLSERIWRKALKNTGLKVGLVWVGLLVFAAVFAPFLANSMPLLESKAGHWQMPVLAYLNLEDVAVLVLFFLGLLFLYLPIPLGLGKRFSLWLLCSLLLVVAVSFVLKSQDMGGYEKFRSTEYNADVAWRIMPPIPYSPRDYLRDYGDTSLEAPLIAGGLKHWLGTDDIGGDVLSRMIHASRIALSIGFIATSIAMVIGVVIGGLMGYFSGWVDIFGMRLVEIFEAIPTLFLLLTFVAFFGSSLYLMMVIIGVTSWSGYARYIRAEFLKLRQQDYVQAAIVGGLPLSSILFRHMLPNGVAPLLVAASFGVASAILAEATLSFLGLGLVDAPSWGQMLNQAVKASSFNWWLAVFPGGAIFLTVFAYNLIGEALRDAIDPKLSQKAGVGA